MATIPTPPTTLWQERFNRNEQQELMHADTEAFSNVTGILLFVVCVGVVLATISVLFILNAGMPGLF